MKRLLVLLFIALAQFVNAQDLYDMHTLREMTIKFYDPDYHQTLIDWFNAGDGSRLPASLEMDGVLYDSVGIRYKGNISYTLAILADTPKYPLNIDINEYVDDQTLMGYKKLKLGNLYTDPTAVREAVAYDIYRKYCVAPKSNMIRVNIGVVGEEAIYHGVYSNTESINKDFLKAHYGWKKGPLVKCDPNPQDAELACDNSGLGNGTGGEIVQAMPDLVWYGPDSCQYYANYEMKTDHGWGELVDFIDVLNNEDSLLYDNLNIDAVLWYMAVSMVIPNLDTYFGKNIKNYYLYKHRDSLWHMIPWDVNETFGGVMGPAHADWNVVKWIDPDEPVNPEEPNRPLIEQILKHDRYYKQYFAHMRTVIEENYNEENISAKFDSIQNLIEQSVLEDPFKRFPDEAFNDNMDEDVFYEDLGYLNFFNGVIPTLNNRLTYLESHPEINKIPPTLSNTSRTIEAPQEGQDVWVTSVVSNATQVDLMISTHKEYSSFFEPVEMRDDGLSNDGLAGDGIYGALIPFQSMDDEIRYYVRAQNDDAMILEPRRAEYEFFEYTIEEANNTTNHNDGKDVSKVFKVYPNPAGEFINITGDLRQLNTVSIYDVNGRLVYHSNEPGDERISIRNLRAGLYFVSFSSIEGVQLLKLVVNN